MYTKRIVTGILFLAGAAALAAAQSGEEPYGLSAGDKALSFDFSSFDVGEFNGGFGGKLCTSEEFAWVLGVDAGYRDHDSQGESATDKQSAWELGLALGFERHRRLNGRISPYLGSDLQISYAEQTVNQSGGTQRETRRTTWGVDLLVGVECWILPDVTLAAQYDLGFRRGASEEKHEGYADRESDIFSAGISSTSLTLSFYF